jgi:hypothetical protein
METIGILDGSIMATELLDGMTRHYVPSLTSMISSATPPVGFTMHRFDCCFAWTLTEAENLAGVFIVPVSQVFYTVLLLNLEVFGVSLGDRLSSQSLHLVMNIHIECHCNVLLSRGNIRAKVWI